MAALATALVFNPGTSTAQASAAPAAQRPNPSVDSGIWGP
jgi:hypothetical protein